MASSDGRPALRAVDPVGQLGGRRPLARGQESRNSQRHNRNRLLGRFPLRARDLEQLQRLVGQAGQFGFSARRRTRRPPRTRRQARHRR